MEKQKEEEEAAALAAQIAKDKAEREQRMSEQLAQAQLEAKERQEREDARRLAVERDELQVQEKEAEAAREREERIAAGKDIRRRRELEREKARLEEMEQMLFEQRQELAKKKQEKDQKEKSLNERLDRQRQERENAAAARKRAEEAAAEEKRLQADFDRQQRVETLLAASRERHEADGAKKEDEAERKRFEKMKAKKLRAEARAKRAEDRKAREVMLKASGRRGSMVASLLSSSEEDDTTDSDDDGGNNDGGKKKRKADGASSGDDDDDDDETMLARIRARAVRRESSDKLSGNSTPAGERSRRNSIVGRRDSYGSRRGSGGNRRCSGPDLLQVVDAFGDDRKHSRRGSQTPPRHARSKNRRSSMSKSGFRTREAVEALAAAASTVRPDGTVAGHAALAGRIMPNADVLAQQLIDRLHIKYATAHPEFFTDFHRLVPTLCLAEMNEVFSEATAALSTPPVPSSIDDLRGEVLTIISESEPLLLNAKVCGDLIGVEVEGRKARELRRQTLERLRSRKNKNEIAMRGLEAVWTHLRAKANKKELLKLRKLFSHYVSCRVLDCVLRDSERDKASTALHQGWVEARATAIVVAKATEDDGALVEAFGTSLPVAADHMFSSQNPMVKQRLLSRHEHQIFVAALAFGDALAAAGNDKQREQLLKGSDAYNDARLENGFEATPFVDYLPDGMTASSRVAVERAAVTRRAELTQWLAEELAAAVKANGGRNVRMAPIEEKMRKLCLAMAPRLAYELGALQNEMARGEHDELDFVAATRRRSQGGAIGEPFDNYPLAQAFCAAYHNHALYTASVNRQLDDDLQYPAHLRAPFNLLTVPQVKEAVNHAAFLVGLLRDKCKLDQIAW
jgi:hypothetical protein